MKVTLRLHKSWYLLQDDIEFGPYLLTREGQLQCQNGARIQLSARLGCILFELASKKGAAVSRLDLIEHCWPDNSIGEENLTRAIADLRKILRGQGDDCIETVYGLGYRLITGRSEFDHQETLSFCQEAWHRVYQRQIVTLDSAELLFTQVNKKEKGYLPALLGLAETQFHRMHIGYKATIESAPKALAVLDRAVELDPACADALALKGLLLTWAEWNFAGAEDELKRACELQPNAYLPNQASAWHQLALGKFDSAEHHFKAASEARPSAMIALAGRAFALMYLGDNQKALNIARKMIQTDPQGAVSLIFAANFEAALGVATKAVSMAQQGFEQMPESPVSGAILAYALARAGAAKKARALLESKTKSGFLIGSNSLAGLAWLELGESAFALSALESGFATRCAWLLPMLNDPRIETLDCEQIKTAIYT